MSSNDALQLSFHSSSTSSYEHLRCRTLEATCLSRYIFVTFLVKVHFCTNSLNRVSIKLILAGLQYKYIEFNYKLSSNDGRGPKQSNIRPASWFLPFHPPPISRTERKGAWLSMELVGVDKLSAHSIEDSFCGKSFKKTQRQTYSCTNFWASCTLVQVHRVLI